MNLKETHIKIRELNEKLKTIPLDDKTQIAELRHEIVQHQKSLQKMRDIVKQTKM